MSTTASFVIDFGSIEDAHLSVELDEERNKGITTFQKGDSVYFRISKDVNYEISLSSGSVTLIAEDEQEAVEAETISFIKTNVANVNKKCVSVTANNWYGNNYGAITPAGVTSVSAANADSDSLGIVSIDYLTEYDVWQLTPPAGMTDVFHIIVYIEAVAS